MSTPAADAAALDKKASYLELFFDLVFVFAITQLAAMLHGDHSAAGWVQALLVSWLVWWAWSQFTWAGNAIDLERRATRVAILAVAGVILLAAVAIPDAFGNDGWRFAVPYALVRFAGLGLYWAGSRHDAAGRAALRTYLPVASISPVLVLAGGIAPSGLRPWIWAAAVAVDLASAAAAGRGEFRIAPGHFAERHALIVIIALGESIIAVGATATGLERSPALVVTAMAGFAVVAALWWDYFDRVHGAAEHRLAGEPDHRIRSNLARDLFTLGHFPLVVGTVVFAVGVEEAVVHPTDALPTFGRLAMGVGVALFLGGFVLAGLRSGSGLAASRLVTILAASVILVAGAAVLSAMVVLVLLAVAVVAGAAFESARPAHRGA